MNNILTYVLIGTFCFLGKELKLTESSFTEIAPGIATGDIVTQFNIEIKSTGNKKISIDNIWLKNTKASWTLMDSDQKKLESINEKGLYTIKGEIQVKTEAGRIKGKPMPEEEKATFEEDFVVAYKVKDGSTMKYLKIEIIENIKTLKKK